MFYKAKLVCLFTILNKFRTCVLYSIFTFQEAKEIRKTKLAKSQAEMEKISHGSTDDSLSKIVNQSADFRVKSEGSQSVDCLQSPGQSVENSQSSGHSREKTASSTEKLLAFTGLFSKSKLAWYICIYLTNQN